MHQLRFADVLPQEALSAHSVAGESTSDVCAEPSKVKGSTNNAIATAEPPHRPRPGYQPCRYAALPFSFNATTANVTNSPPVAPILWRARAAVNSAVSCCPAP